MDRFYNREDAYDDYEDRQPCGKVHCPRCGNLVPEDHLDTDSGNCISCEDRDYDERAGGNIYRNCLIGYPFRPEKKKVVKPKKGDIVSLKVIGYGLVSWETSKLERISKNKCWTEGRDMPFEYPSGRGESVLGLRVDVVFDGGKGAKEYEESK